MDGAKWGLTDLYEDFEDHVLSALREGEDFDTGWYSSKKECASARMIFSGDEIRVQVSVTDDFDTDGFAERSKVVESFTPEEHLKAAKILVDLAWESALLCQSDNATVLMFKITHRGRWVETFLAPVGDGHNFKSPPGDCYHRWGFQGEARIPKKIARIFGRAAGRCESWKHRSWRLEAVT